MTTMPYVTKETQILAEHCLTRERQFVEILVAGGTTATDAYIKAGFEERRARHNASRLLRSNENVKAYYNHLLKLKTAVVLKKIQTTVNRIASKEEVAARLTELGMANLVDFMNEDGEPVLNRDIPNNGAAREFYHRRHKDSAGNVITTKSIKLVDPVAALDKLCDVVGYKAPAKSAIAQRVEIVHQHYRYSKDRESLPGARKNLPGEGQASIEANAAIEGESTLIQENPQHVIEEPGRNSSVAPGENEAPGEGMRP